MEITYGDRTVNSWFDASTANEIKTVVNYNEIKRVDASLSSEEILAGTIKQIIASPGSGKYINVISAKGILKHGGISYVAPYPINIASEPDLTNIVGADAYIMESNQTQFCEFITNIYCNTLEDKPLYLGISGGTPTTGNGTFKIVVYYRIEDY